MLENQWFALRKQTFSPTGHMLIKSKNSFKCFFLTSKCSRKWKASLLDLWVHCCPTVYLIVMGLDDITRLWFQSQPGHLFFTLQSYGLLGDLKWNHTHGWLHWWFTFTANSLSSGALLPLISLQQATHCEVLITTICVTALMWWCQTPRRHFVVTVKWYLTDTAISFFVCFHQGTQTELI